MDVGGGMPRQSIPPVLSSPGALCSPPALQSVPGCGNAWEEEGAAPGSLRAQCESSATSAHPKYPSIPQDNPESPHGKPQNSPGCDTAHIPSAQAAQGCALLKSAVACLVS